MSDKQFFILLTLAAIGAYLYVFGVPERATQATGNPLTLPTAVYTIDTSDQIMIVTATPDASGLTNFIVIDDSGDPPEINDLIPVLPPTATQQPEAIINWSEELSNPTATPRELTDEQLLACLKAQEDGRRMAPYCPTNPAELLGEGR